MMEWNGRMEWHSYLHSIPLLGKIFSEKSPFHLEWPWHSTWAYDMLGFCTNLKPLFWRVLWEMCIFEPKKTAKGQSWKSGAIEMPSGLLQPTKRPQGPNDRWASSGPLQRKFCWNEEDSQWLLQEFPKLRDYSQRPLQHSVATAI